jgi:hypothetical protein
MKSPGASIQSVASTNTTALHKAMAMVRSIVAIQVGAWMGTDTGGRLVRVIVSMARSEHPFSREDASTAVGGEATIVALRAEIHCCTRRLRGLWRALPSSNAGLG